MKTCFEGLGKETPEKEEWLSRRRGYVILTVVVVHETNCVKEKIERFRFRYDI